MTQSDGAAVASFHSRGGDAAHDREQQLVRGRVQDAALTGRGRVCIVAPVSSRSGRWWRRAATVAMGCVLALALAELTLRVLGLPDTNRLFLAQDTADNPAFVADPELFWRLSPSAPECNAAGLRGPWCGGPKAANETRILAVGDSCTFGSEIAWEQTYAVQLERLLQCSRRGPVRAATAALPGYSTFQNRRLLARVLPDVQPDIAIFYCGAWNDFVPAAGADDATLAARLATSRLLALLLGALGPDLEPLREAFRRGQAPHGRRVAPAAFAANLEHMAAACRDAGARVLLVVPGHPADTTSKFPGLAEYRRIVADTARRLGVPAIDLTEVAQRLDPGGAPPIAGDATACFHDWVHPSGSLHTALAQELARALGENERAATEAPPAVLTAEAGQLRVALPAASAGPLHRVWLGTQPVPAATRDAGLLRVPLADDLPPGTHDLELVDAAGPHLLGRFVVAPCALAASCERSGAELAFTVSGRGAPDRLVWVWFATARAAAPVATPFGAFELDVPALARPTAGVLRFDLAADNRHQTTVASNGEWTLRVEAPAAAVAAAVLHVQALVLDPASRRGALSAPTSLVLPAGR